ncbi:MAG: phage Gp37/Gp68 family protein [Leptospira sp.]|nr:phage Gp37/Gp68 family protein [Leptospira sp.]
MNNSSIEWTDKTWNPVSGCSKVSAGCKNCYADAMFTRFKSKWGEFNDVKCHEDKLDEPFKLKKPSKIFVNSMSDLFHEKVPFEFIDKVMAVIALNPKHTFQVLTKRPERMKEYFDSWNQIGGDFNLTEAMDEIEEELLRHEISGELKKQFRPERGNEIDDSLIYDSRPPVILKNLWLGVSVEDQKTADERIPVLLHIPSYIRFLSCEPLLGRIKFDDLLKNWNAYDPKMFKIDWVIVGGESGIGAREMHPDWVRSILSECADMSIPFFFKQWGEWISTDQGSELDEIPVKPEHLIPINIGGRLSTHSLIKVGKKKAGSLLDGKEWKEFPRVGGMSMENNKPTELEEKIIQAAHIACMESGMEKSPTPNRLIDKLRKIMPPTCTTNERQFLDEIREKCKWFPYSDGMIGMKPNGNATNIFQVNFETNLRELVE